MASSSRYHDSPEPGSRLQIITELINHPRASKPFETYTGLYFEQFEGDEKASAIHSFIHNSFEPIVIHFIHSQSSTRDQDVGRPLYDLARAILTSYEPFNTGSERTTHTFPETLQQNDRRRHYLLPNLENITMPHQRFDASLVRGDREQSTRKDHRKTPEIDQELSPIVSEVDTRSNSERKMNELYEAVMADDAQSGQEGSHAGQPLMISSDDESLSDD